MASRETTLKDQALVVQRRMDALGLASYPVPANSGRRRTEAKKALLRELEELRQSVAETKDRKAL